MARRRYQQGMLLLSGKRNPAWFGRWREDFIVNGKLKRCRRKEFLGYKKDLPTRKLALREMESRLAAINQPSRQPLRLETFTQFVDWWETNVLTKYKLSTQSSTRSQIKNALRPFFGNLLMKDIQWQTVQSFISGCSKAPKTCKNYIITLKLMWKSARAGGWASHDPFEALTLPRCYDTDPDFYTADEARALIAAAEGQYKTLYWIAAEPGLRAGELCALKWEDIDFENATIKVSRSLWGSVIQTPKNRNARRSIPLSPKLLAHLERYRKEWKSNELGLMFVAPRGGPLRPSVVTRDQLGKICKKLGIVARRLKAFRHCSASIMDQENIPSVVRQERLGHRPGSKVTMVHYTHSVPADHRAAAETVGQILAS